MLLAAAIQQQCKILDLGIARDDKEELERILDKAFSAGIHILLTSGGVSMGDRDFVKPLLENRGTVHFNKVNLCPFVCFFYNFTLAVFCFINICSEV
jgi:gephyrin